MKFYLLLVTILLQSCAVWTYGIRPDKAWDAQKTGKKNQTLYYGFKRTTTGLPLSDKYDMEETFKENMPQTDLIKVEDIPSKGKYIELDLEYIISGNAGLIWGYIAASTLFILPAYSSGTGYWARYRIYNNGKKIRTYEYHVKRKVFAWLPMLALVWFNAFTDSEVDALEATTRQFVLDAQQSELL